MDDRQSLLKETAVQLEATHKNSRKLWEFLASGRAYTLNELSMKSKIEKEKLAGILQNLSQHQIISQRETRVRPYFFISSEIRTLKFWDPYKVAENKKPTGMKYCRHCYKHLAGYVGVKLEEALVDQGYLRRQLSEYEITAKGKDWFSKLGISIDKLHGKHLTKACLDFSERKSHVGGALGDALLATFFKNQWVKQVPDSREISLTKAGKIAFKNQLGLEF